MNQRFYTIDIREKMVERWHALEDEFPENMQWFKDFLKRHPTNTIITHGKVKRLKGDFKRYYQYDVSYKDRVRYAVDRDNYKVQIVFAKGHP